MNDENRDTYAEVMITSGVLFFETQCILDVSFEQRYGLDDMVTSVVVFYASSVGSNTLQAADHRARAFPAADQLTRCQTRRDGTKRAGDSS